MLWPHSKLQHYSSRFPKIEKNWKIDFFQFANKLQFYEENKKYNYRKIDLTSEINVTINK